MFLILVLYINCHRYEGLSWGFNTNHLVWLSSFISIPHCFDCYTGGIYFIDIDVTVKFLQHHVCFSINHHFCNLPSIISQTILYNIYFHYINLILLQVISSIRKASFSFIVREHWLSILQHFKGISLCFFKCMILHHSHYQNISINTSSQQFIGVHFALWCHLASSQ